MQTQTQNARKVHADSSERLKVLMKLKSLKEGIADVFMHRILGYRARRGRKRLTFCYSL